MSTTFQRSNYRFVIREINSSLYCGSVYFNDDVLLEFFNVNKDSIVERLQSVSKALFNLTDDIHALDTNLLVKTS